MSRYCASNHQTPSTLLGLAIHYRFFFRISGVLSRTTNVTKSVVACKISEQKLTIKTGYFISKAGNEFANSFTLQIVVSGDKRLLLGKSHVHLSTTP